VAVGNYPAGTIRYVNYTGQDGKTYTKKQKYYWLKLSIASDGTYGIYSIYKEYWATGVGGYPYDHYDYIKDFSNKFKLDYLPDSSIKLQTTGFLNYVKENTFEGDYYNLVEIDKQSSSLFDDYGGIDSVNDYIEQIPNDQQYDFKYRSDFALGESFVFGWAELNKKTDLEQTDAPGALDNDWTLEQAEEKIKDLQLWSDNNLLPPIFGPTNCVYFPSNLGNTKSDKPQDTNPIIKAHPFRGSIRIQSGNTYEYYGMDYPVSSEFQQIKCQKDETFTINCNFPSVDTGSRFDVIQDTYELSSSNQNLNPSTLILKPYLTFQSFKVNQIIEIRFIQPDAIGTGVTKELLFNKYKMKAIITKSDVPTDTIEDNEAWTKKYSITFKFINDLGLNKDEYFNAKVIATGLPVKNYVQNETYCIQRYYNKILGLGPRLGGSVIIASQSSFDSEPTKENLYTLFTVLKDEEKLNKPYENISISMNYNLYPAFTSLVSNYDLIYKFSKQDLPGKFIQIAGNLSDKEDKQYIDNYRSYLIKNLDEHTYEEYRNLKGYTSGLAIFRESNENADLTFGSYE